MKCLQPKAVNRPTSSKALNVLAGEYCKMLCKQVTNEQELITHVQQLLSVPQVSVNFKDDWTGDTLLTMAVGF